VQPVFVQYKPFGLGFFQYGGGGGGGLTNLVWTLDIKQFSSCPGWRDGGRKKKGDGRRQTSEKKREGIKEMLRKKRNQRKEREKEIGSKGERK
jgi:hypothetical protein